MGAGLGRGDQLLLLDPVDAPGDLGRVERIGDRVQRGGGGFVEDAGGAQPLVRGGGFVVDAGFAPSLNTVQLVVLGVVFRYASYWLEKA